MGGCPQHALPILDGKVEDRNSWKTRSIGCPCGSAIVGMEHADIRAGKSRIGLEWINNERIDWNPRCPQWEPECIVPSIEGGGYHDVESPPANIGRKRYVGGIWISGVDHHARDECLRQGSGKG